MGKQYTDEEKTAARSRLDSTVVRFRRDIEIEIERAAEILGHDVEELRREYSGGIQTGVSLLRKLKTQTDGAHLLRGWFARKSVTLWVAGYGSAKTWLAHRLAWNVAQGLPFLEIHPPHPLNVLYVDMESPDFMKEELLEYMPPGKAPRLHHVHLDEKAARECIHTPGYDLIVVDNLQSNRPLMFKENDQMQAHLQARAYQSIARANNCAVLLLFNTGKKIYKEKDDGDFV